MFGANFLDFNCGSYISMQGETGVGRFEDEYWLGVLEVF